MGQILDVEESATTRLYKVSKSDMYAYEGRFVLCLLCCVVLTADRRHIHAHMQLYMPS